MDLEFNEQQKLLKQNARAFMEKEIIPIADEYDRKGISKQELRSLIKKLMPLGYATGPLPEKYGGAGLDLFSFAILVEEGARAWYLVEQSATSITTQCDRLLRLGTEEQQQRFIPPLVALEKTVCSGNSEPNAGSDAGSMQTTAARQGDYYVINGTKTWSSYGIHADYCLLLAVTDRTKGSRGGYSHFMIDKEVSPFEAKPIHLMGVRGHGMAELSFQDCRVPKENLLGGQEGGGYRRQLVLWQRNRVRVALEAVGVGQAAIDASIRYAQDRQQFGRPIGKFQLVQNLIVDMVMKIEAARWLCYRSLSLVERGERCIAETSMAKAFACEAALHATSNAVEIHGAYGLTEECPVQRYYRDARCIAIPEATLEINRLIAGREILGLNAIY